MITSSPIGIFDSGLGGLTVVKEVIKHLPNENLVYLGDTARVPYGTKSQKSVVNFSLQDAEFLMQYDIKCLVIACNTASSCAYQVLKDKYHVEVLNVIEPGAITAVNATRKGKIGMIGTRATVSSKSYDNYIHLLDKDIEVYSKACPLLVPLVEEGWIDKKQTQSILKEYLSYFDDKDIDVLILGCTHYPMLKEVIRNIMGKDVTLVDSAEAVAKNLEYILKMNNLINFKDTKGKRQYFVTDYTESFLSVSRLFLKDNTIKLKTVDLEYILTCQ
ncbi:glutamate racemase [bacterium]|nr:glutamate racemase [bacterium]